MYVYILNVKTKPGIAHANIARYLDMTEVSNPSEASRLEILLAESVRKSRKKKLSNESNLWHMIRKLGDDHVLYVQFFI